MRLRILPEKIFHQIVIANEAIRKPDENRYPENNVIFPYTMTWTLVYELFGWRKRYLMAKRKRREIIMGDFNPSLEELIFSYIGGIPGKDIYCIDGYSLPDEEEKEQYIQWKIKREIQYEINLRKQLLYQIQNKKFKINKKTKKTKKWVRYKKTTINGSDFVWVRGGQEYYLD